jgi:signal transduction histidine kinase
VQGRIEAERTAVLFGKGLLPYLANVIIGGLLVGALGGFVTAARRLGWLAMVAALTLLRVGLWRLHHRRPGLLSPRGWAHAFTVGAAANGAAWGSVALLLWAPESALHRALVGFAVGGMVAGATATVPSFLPAFYLFAGLTLGPLVVRLFASGDAVDVGMGAMTTFFGAAMTQLARSAGRWFLHNTELEARNQALVAGLSQARAELEARVAERTRTLEDTVARLREAEALARRAANARDEFLALASHELRTPIAAIAMQLDRLEWQKAQQGTVDAARLPDSVRSLRRQAIRLTALVDTVLAASGLWSRAIDLDPRELDFAALARRVVADLTADCAPGVAGVSMAIDAPVVGRWDPGRLEQLVLSLVSNAIRFGAGRPVAVSLTGDHGNAVLTVRDHGPGIDPAIRDRIFERFFRADAGMRTGGLGLGLAVVRKIASAMGGEVAVASEPGRGATFTVTLPRVPPAVAG